MMCCLTLKLLLLLLLCRLLHIVLELPSLSDAAFQDTLPDIIAWLHGQRKSCSPQQARLKSCYSRLLFLLSRCSQLVSNSSGGAERGHSSGSAAAAAAGEGSSSSGSYCPGTVTAKLQQLLHGRPRSHLLTSAARHSIDVGAAAAAAGAAGGDRGDNDAESAANAAVELLLRRQQQQAEQQERWQSGGGSSSSRRPQGAGRSRRKSAFGEVEFDGTSNRMGCVFYENNTDRLSSSRAATHCQQQLTNTLPCNLVFSCHSCHSSCHWMMLIQITRALLFQTQHRRCLQQLTTYKLPRHLSLNWSTL
jgi:hypothetical protein